MNLNWVKNIKRLITASSNDQSLAITDRRVLRRYIDDPWFPFLVSFPRTGSHWLRMVMELYFEKPSLVRLFYFTDSRDFLSYHTHDLDLDLYRKNVVYLYRNPVPTIYSQMVYENEDMNDLARITYWTQLYGKHLVKWLIEEKASENKTIVRYENMAMNMAREFRKITDHFGVEFDDTRMNAAIERVSRQEVTKKTSHDRGVIRDTSDYASNRRMFAKEYGSFVDNTILGLRPELGEFIQD